MDIGIAGFGAIGQVLCRLLAEHAPDIRVAAVVARGAPSANAARLLPAHTRVVENVAELLPMKLALVVECAGHEMLRSSGEAILAGGSDLLVASVGALADRTIEASLRRGANAGRSHIRIPAGALGGLDVLGAARFAGLKSVVYTSRKGPQAWKGTAAQAMVDLDGLHEARVFYRANAREAALLFPQNANVAAAVALAGAGFEQTEVVLMADPAAAGNRHEIQAQGDFGEIHVSILGKTLPANPKTSMLAPYSLLRSLINLQSSIVVA